MERFLGYHPPDRSPHDAMSSPLIGGMLYPSCGNVVLKVGTFWDSCTVGMGDLLKVSAVIKDQRYEFAIARNSSLKRSIYRTNLTASIRIHSEKPRSVSPKHLGSAEDGCILGTAPLAVAWSIAR